MDAEASEREGYWRVIGTRHEAKTWARSAEEAIAKCVKAGVVQDWEELRAVYIGEKLPEVF